MVMSLKHFEVT